MPSTLRRLGRPKHGCRQTVRGVAYKGHPKKGCPQRRSQSTTQRNRTYASQWIGAEARPRGIARMRPSGYAPKHGPEESH
eukprot:4603683-Pyramimonas_sp.AAC.1